MNPEPTSPNPLLITSRPRRNFDLKKAKTTFGITEEDFFHALSSVKLTPSPPSHFGPSFLEETFQENNFRTEISSELTFRKRSQNGGVKEITYSKQCNELQYILAMQMYCRFNTGKSIHFRHGKVYDIKSTNETILQLF